jgi:membrane associated rhomboid family serine protease
MKRMRYYQKDYRKRFSLGQSGNALMMLIAVHLCVFIIFAFIKVVFRVQYTEAPDALAAFDRNIMSWFTLPADMAKLGERPWTVLTHMFVHDGLWHIFGNMLWLWMFGYILQDLTGNRKIVPIFIYGALAGAVSFLLLYNFAPAFKGQASHATALGASAGVMAVAVATTMVSPGYRIFPMLRGGIALWVITVAYLVIDLATIPYTNPGGRVAHLAGGFMGFLFIVFMKRGYDWSDWMSNFFDWVNNLFNPDKPRKGKSVREQLFYKSSGLPFHKTSNITQQRIDEILDKINQQGYQFLTEEEKEMLKRASQEDI